MSSLLFSNDVKNRPMFKPDIRCKLIFMIFFYCHFIFHMSKPNHNKYIFHNLQNPGINETEIVFIDMYKY